MLPISHFHNYFELLKRKNTSFKDDAPEYRGIRLQAVPFWLVERMRSKRSETGARRNKREETGGEAFFPPLPKSPTARLLQFFHARLFCATSRLSRKGRLAVLRRYSRTVYDYSGKANLSEGFWSPNRNLWVTTHFTGIIKQQYITMHGIFFPN